MGDPKKSRKKYKRPRTPWEKERILKEREIKQKYGLKNKREIWRVKTIVDNFRAQARKLLGSTGEEREKLEKQLISKLVRWGLLNENSELSDVLRLTTEDLLERRLQTIVYRKGLARTIKQARQLVVHKHVLIGDRIVNKPSYIVKKDEEDKIKLSEDIYAKIFSPQPKEQIMAENVGTKSS